MNKKVDYDLNDQIIRDVTKDFVGWDENTTYEIELCQFKTSKGKDFYRLLPNNDEISDLILKVFPIQDGSMAMTEDSDMRELLFVNSELHNEFSKDIGLPNMSKYRTEEGFGILCMEDISEELTKVGPPTPPTKGMVTNLIKTIGKLHAKHWQEEKVVENYPWLMDFKLWLKRGMKLLLIVIGEDEGFEWAQKILENRSDLKRAMPSFLESLSSEEKEQFINILKSPEVIMDRLEKMPWTVSHNDLFFSNLGLKDDQLLLIDWEFVGYSPAAWDIHSAYAGIPPIGVNEEDMVEIYFDQISQATEDEKAAWLDGYKIMGAVEGLIYGLRTLVPKVYDPESDLPEKFRPMLSGEIEKIVNQILMLD